MTSNDFSMIKTVIVCRLNKAVASVNRQIQEYNQKINELRTPIIKRIQKYYTERHNLPLVHPLTGIPAKKDFLHVSASYLNDELVRISASYNEGDELTSASFNLTTHVLLNDDFKKDLKGKDFMTQPVFDVDSMATEKAAEIVLEAVPEVEITEFIDASIKSLIPTVTIPKINEVVEDRDGDKDGFLKDIKVG